MDKKFENIYFIGIGGIGMSALAQYFYTKGYRVAGYDKVRNEMCIRLEKLGINIHYEDNMNMVTSYYKNSEKTAIIYTPAIPQNHNELNWFLNNNFKIFKRSEILGKISSSKKTIAIAGTHGKTSVSGICANILSNSSKSCTAFLGGILKNKNSNFLIDNNSDFMVVEADEYDRSFLKLQPFVAVITSVEPDHLDIYKDFDTLYQAFQDYANKTRNLGSVILNNKIDFNFSSPLRKDLKIFRYGLNDDTCDFNLYNIIFNGQSCIFDIKHPDGIISKINYAFPGNHNLENALAATSAALTCGLDPDDVKKGLEGFKGINRRFDYIVQTQNAIYIDDYAHHPSEISAFLSAVKTLYPTKKLTGIFQPHLYSRTAEFYEKFAESLSICDDIILLPIYPAREEPIPGVSSEMILNLIKSPVKQICEKDKLIEIIETKKPELLVSMGAGDIDQLVSKIKICLTK